MEQYMIGDKVLIYIYDFDDNGYDFYTKAIGHVTRHIHGYGYNVKLIDKLKINLRSEPIMALPSAEDIERSISVTYNEVLDQISKNNEDSWTTLDALKHRWSMLTFRYANFQQAQLETYKKGHMGDKSPVKLSMDYSGYTQFAIANCWFDTNTTINEKDILAQNIMIVGIIDPENPKKLKNWSFCDERLYQLWWIICKSDSINYYTTSSFRLKSDEYSAIAEYVLYNRTEHILPAKFKQKFNETILWYK